MPPLWGLGVCVRAFYTDAAPLGLRCVAKSGLQTPPTSQMNTSCQKLYTPQTISRLTSKYLWMRMSLNPAIFRHTTLGYFSRTESGTYLTASPMTSRFRMTASIRIRSVSKVSRVTPCTYSWILSIASNTQLTWLEVFWSSQHCEAQGPRATNGVNLV